MQRWSGNETTAHGLQLGSVYVRNPMYTIVFVILTNIRGRPSIEHITCFKTGSDRERSNKGSYEKTVCSLVGRLRA